MRYRKEIPMSDDLATLETQRSKLLEEFLGLGDLRPGSITAVTRRCGKSSCHCAKHNDPGHDPQFRLTRRVAGKTVTESFPNPIALRKAQQEVPSFTASSNSARAWSPSTSRSVDSVRRRKNAGAGRSRKKNGCCDPSRGGTGSKPTARPSLRATPEEWPDRSGSGRVRLASRSPPSRCRRLNSTAAIRRPGDRRASVTVLLRRSCSLPGNPLQTPVDDRRPGAPLPPLLLVLALSPRTVSGRCRTGRRKHRVFSRCAAHACSGRAAGPFDHGREQMQVLAGLTVTTKSVERIAEGIGGDLVRSEQAEREKALQLDLPVLSGDPIPILYVQMDGTGIPVVKKETVGRSGKSDGQPAHTREVKLGCVFTQTRWDEKGFALRDPDSTTYTGAIESAAEFGQRIYREALQRGWSRARKKVIIGDGAEWIWNLVAEHFPGAREIVDLYHARQHLWAVARQLYPQEEVQQKAWMRVHQKPLLDRGKIEKLVSALRAIATTNPHLAEK